MLRSSGASFVCYAAVMVMTAGCATDPLATDYGRHFGAGHYSVNGTAVWADMFESFGHRVSRCRDLNKRGHEFDTVVWLPDDFDPPTLNQRIAVEQWLSAGPRTFIYVGRDYDAESHYWDQVAPHSAPDDRPLMWARRAHAQAQHEHRRLRAPSRKFVRWFTYDRDAVPHRVTSLESAAQWQQNIDGAKANIVVQTQFMPVDSDPDAVQSAVMTSRQHIDRLMDIDPAEVLRQFEAPDSSEVLLAGDNIALVTRLTDDAWPGSQILVVTNGSFLLNMPLVNHEHRKLAARLIEACGPPGEVGMLDRPPELLHSDSETPGDPQPVPTSWLAFRTWPLGLILMQGTLLGVVLCLAMFPIFGRPRTAEDSRANDFGRHIDALGHLLQQTRSEDYARAQLQNYHRGIPLERQFGKDFH